jgi:hypothetical protein
MCRGVFEMSMEESEILAAMLGYADEPPPVPRGSDSSKPGAQNGTSHGTAHVATGVTGSPRLSTCQASAAVEWICAQVDVCHQVRSPWHDPCLGAWSRA